MYGIPHPTPFRLAWVTAFIILIFSCLYREREKTKSTLKHFYNYITISKETNPFGNERRSSIPMFTLGCLMKIQIWRHFLANSARAKNWYGDDAITMMWWPDNDDAIEHRFIVIVPSQRRHRVIASSYHRIIYHQVIALANCHAIVIAL